MNICAKICLLEGLIMYCSYCGNEEKNSAKFCTCCGAELSKSNTQTGNNQTNKDTTKKSENKSKTSDGAAIIAYITWIGFLVALILNANDKNDYVEFHLNQALVLNLFSLIGFIPVIGWIIDIIVWVFRIMGIVNAYKGEKAPLPVIGDIHIIG